MDQIVECVPNFSEGTDKKIINQITSEITSTEGVYLLDVDPGKDTNRTVVTFVGAPDEVIEAAFKAIKKAADLINMAVHKGAHPRMGATDVCPLIPVSGITIEECVTYAKKLGRRVGNELKIPVYFYGNAATRPDRFRLPDIREGEYEALPEKLKDADFKPDAGPAVFNASTGATAIGVRGFMLAYNVNLNTKDVFLVKEIAMNIRESGRALRDKNGEIIRDKDRKAKRLPGKLEFCQAGGWYIEEYGYSQVTMNLHNYEVTGLHTAYNAVCEEADKFGLWVTGSELIGVAPKQALIDAGIHYLIKDGRNRDVSEETIIQTAIQFLGLNDTTPFKPEEKIIEYAIQAKKRDLVNLSIQGFVNELSSDSPAPGGGSVSALSGALSAGLASMVANVTFGKKKYEKYDKIMEEVSLKAKDLKDLYIDLIEKDTEAFNTYMKAVKMPKRSDEEKKERSQAIEKAAKFATEIPFNTLNLALSLLELAENAVKMGNANALSDAAVCAIQAGAAAEGAWMNVMINLPVISDEEFVEKIKVKSDEMIAEVKKKKEEIITHVRKQLEK